MDLLSYLLSRKYVDNSIRGISGTLAGKNCTINSVTKTDGVTTIIFKWTADDSTVKTTEIQINDGETPTIDSTEITGGHRLTFTTTDPTQSISFDVMDGEEGQRGVSVINADVDSNNYLKLTLSDGNVINAGQIKTISMVDTELSTSSTNPVQNRVITTELNKKVDKVSGKQLSTEDFTTAEKNKLSNIENNAQVNTLEGLIINGEEATIIDKKIALNIITSAVSNLQNYYLKSETYTKQEVEDLIGSTVGVTIEIVQTLPTVGQTNIIYFLPTETANVYSQYIYTANDGWILIGSTSVDLSNYYTKAQVDTLLNGKQNILTIDAFPTAMSNNPVASGGVYSAIAQMQPQFQFTNMPTASADNLGFVYQYIGNAGTYTPNMFYRCVYNSYAGEYKWEEVIFHATVTVDNELSPTSTNPVQNKVVKEALDTKQDIMQFAVMPSAQDNLGKIVQYTGSTTGTYQNGCFYKAVYDSEHDVYIWNVVRFSADISVDNVLSDVSENPVQNKVITQKLETYLEKKITMPVASESENYHIYLYVGDTTQYYKKGIVYQCVSDGAVTPTYSWVALIDFGTAAFKNSTDRVSPNNTDLVESQSVYSAINTALSSIYTPRGNLTCAELTSSLLISENIGNVYEMSDSGTTTALFLQGAGESIAAGDNVGIINAGEGRILFNLMANAFDLTDYQKKDLTTPITIGGTNQTTVEGALSALNTEIKNVEFQFTQMPTASIDYLDKIVQYIGTTTSTYVNGKFYKCVGESYPVIYSWKPINGDDEFVTLEMFGAVGDGITNDTSAFIQALNSGKEIHLMNKTYLIGASITQDHTTIKGKGKIKGTLTINANYVSISDIEFQSGGSCIVLQSGKYITFDKIKTDMCKNSFYIPKPSQHQPISRVLISNSILSSEYGFNCDNDEYTYYSMGDLQIINTQFFSKVYGIRGKWIDGLVITGCTFFTQAHEVQLTDKKNNINVIGSNYINITGCNLFEAGEESIYLSDVRGVTINGNNIVWCGQVVPSGGIVIDGIHKNVNLSSIEITNNNIQYPTDDAIVIKNISDIDDANENYVISVTDNTILNALGTTFYYGTDPLKNMVYVVNSSTTNPNKVLIDNNIGTGSVYPPYALTNKELTDNKADKVTSATNGDLASLDANGNLVDSGIAKDNALSFFTFDIGVGKQRTITFPQTIKGRINISAVNSGQMHSYFEGNIVGYGAWSGNRSLLTYINGIQSIVISDIDNATNNNTFIIANPISDKTATVIITLYNMDKSNFTIGSEVTSTITAMGSTWKKFVTTSDISYSIYETKTSATWIDGKPIYRKVVDTGAFPNATSKSVNHNISNIGTIINIRCMGIASNGITINVGYTSSPIYCYVDGEKVYISSGTTDMSAYTSSYTIIEYTKTTD